MSKATLIISFYNKIDYLRLVLAGLETQSEKNFKIIIADDGSAPNIVTQLSDIIKNSTLKIKHTWHEDKGFRKNKILNQAVLLSSTEYLIFIDGDCIPHKEFIKEHLNYYSLNTVLTGRRVNLSEKFTSLLSPEKVENQFLQKNYLRLIQDGIFGKSNYVEKGIYFRNILLRKTLNKKHRGLLGCNFSLYKKDLIDVNGFDERYEAPSIGEDSDIQFRLELNGVKVKSLNNIAVQYHLYHKLQNRALENLILFEKIKKDRIAFTPFGIKC